MLEVRRAVDLATLFFAAGFDVEFEAKLLFAAIGRVIVLPLVVFDLFVEAFFTVLRFRVFMLLFLPGFRARPFAPDRCARLCFWRNLLKHLEFFSNWVQKNEKKLPLRFENKGIVVIKT